MCLTVPCPRGQVENLTSVGYDGYARLLVREARDGWVTGSVAKFKANKRRILEDEGVSTRQATRPNRALLLPSAATAAAVSHCCWALHVGRTEEKGGEEMSGEERSGEEKKQYRRRPSPTRGCTAVLL